MIYCFKRNCFYNDFSYSASYPSSQQASQIASLLLLVPCRLPKMTFWIFAFSEFLLFVPCRFAKMHAWALNVHPWALTLSGDCDS